MNGNSCVEDCPLPQIENSDKTECVLPINTGDLQLYFPLSTYFKVTTAVTTPALCTSCVSSSTGTCKALNGVCSAY